MNLKKNSHKIHRKWPIKIKLANKNENENENELIL